ncbi:endoplasmic reticulum-Golgi intermediate compartment protein 3 [Forsythia ovata]|uniref:Endoplasmic reticulum-Golgi intermediate compartment protein 3 n=1 Tax=Forsythia ovata TaxID=205694 RepID=A0ABD1NWM1_9LAMI
MGLKQALKSLDAFPRAEEHLLQKTKSGALVQKGFVASHIDDSAIPPVIIWALLHGPKANDHKDHHEESNHKIELHSFDKVAENMIERVKHALANGEGCRVYGVLDVQRVAGNFHTSVHGLNIFIAQMVNFSSNFIFFFYPVLHDNLNPEFYMHCNISPVV